MPISLKRILFVTVLSIAVLGIGRAALLKFQQKQQALLAEARAQMKQLGLTAAAAKAKYPTPQIGMVSSGCLLPGSTGEVVVRGKFSPGSKFVFQNDNLTVVKESLTPTEYRATVQVAPNVGPESASVWVMSPSAVTASSPDSISIGGRYEWEMKAANGWKIVARAPASKGCGGTSESRDAYEVLFYRAGEANPFEKRGASLYHSMYETDNYRFSIREAQPEGMPSQETMAGLMQKFQDPNLTEAQREKLMKQMEQMQQQVMTAAGRMADPNYVKQQEAKKQQFGCEHIALTVGGASFTGHLQCAPAVGREIALTGTMKHLGK